MVATRRDARNLDNTGQIDAVLLMAFAANPGVGISASRLASSFDTNLMSLTVPDIFFTARPHSRNTRRFRIPGALIQEALPRLHKAGYLESTSEKKNLYRISDAGLEYLITQPAKDLIDAAIKIPNLAVSSPDSQVAEVWRTNMLTDPIHRSTKFKPTPPKNNSPRIEQTLTDRPEYIQLLALRALQLAKDLKFSPLGNFKDASLAVDQYGIIQQKLVELLAMEVNALVSVHVMMPPPIKDAYFSTTIGGKHYHCSSKDAGDTIKALERERHIEVREFHRPAKYDQDRLIKQGTDIKYCVITDSGSDLLQNMLSQKELDIDAPEIKDLGVPAPASKFLKGGNGEGKKGKQ